MLKLIKNNLRKEANPVLEHLKRFESIVYRKTEENVYNQKKKAFFDNNFFIMIYGILILLMSSLLSFLFSIFSSGFLLSIVPKDINEVLVGSFIIFYFFSSFTLVFFVLCHSHNVIAHITKRIPCLKNITHYFEEKNQIKNDSLSYFLKESIFPVSSRQMDLMNKAIQKMDENTINKIKFGLKKEKSNVMVELENIFSKIKEKTELSVNEKVFLMAKIKNVTTSEYDVVFELLEN